MNATSPDQTVSKKSSPPQQTGKDSSKNNTGAMKSIKWDEILDIISDNAFMDWNLLAKELKLSPREIDNIRRSAATCQERCWKVLDLWKSRSQSHRRAAELIDVLKRCRHRRMADIVSKLVFQNGSLEEVLGQHVVREEKMRHSFHLLADLISAHWRLLVQKLGLTTADIADIEARFEGRKREKLMHALYKWRLMVPLQDYKVASLILATKSIGQHKVADELTTFTDAPQWTKRLRKRRQGEAMVHIDLAHLDLLDTGDKERRPQILSAKETLRDYALNKLFIHLADSLDDQDIRGAHPLVLYLYELNKSTIARISRSGSYVLIRCPSEAEVDELRQLSQSGELQDKFTQFLVTDEILQELGLIAIRLTATIVDEELLTTRSYASSRASFSSLDTGSGNTPRS